MEETIVLIRGTFHNIYFYGKGYRDIEACQNWHKAIKEVKSYFWLVREVEDVTYLVGCNGSIFLHPMDFRAVLHSCGCNTDDTFDCGDLERICKEIAEKCGGTFELEVSKPITVKADIEPYSKGIHNTLSA